MALDIVVHAGNLGFARSVRAKFDLAAEGSVKELARMHLQSADMAERCNNEAEWILAINRAAKVLG